MVVQMNKAILRDEVNWLVEAITEQFDIIKAYEGKVPQIEFDIILENVRKLYENLHMLSRVNDPYEFLEQREKERETPAQEPLIIPEPLIRIQYGRNSESGEIPEAEPVAAEKNSMQAESEVPVDLFGGELSGFNEKLKEARDKSPGMPQKKDRPNDLKSLISINEKFLFINELFDGNLRDYNENMEILNNYTDLKTATEFLDLLRKKNLWDSASGAFRKLKELLDKRFA
jgi:hypothetical protein